ncbi:MAG: hypothetical protein SGARI_003703, partial [Bacillariaceae sp.]
MDHTQPVIIVTASDCKSKVVLDVMPLQVLKRKYPGSLPGHIKSVQVHSCLKVQTNDRSIPLLETDKYPSLFQAVSLVANKNGMVFTKTALMQTLRQQTQTKFYMNATLVVECLFTPVADWPSNTEDLAQKQEKKQSQTRKSEARP